MLPIDRSTTRQLSHNDRNHLTCTAPLTVAMSSNIKERINSETRLVVPAAQHRVTVRLSDATNVQMFEGL